MKYGYFDNDKREYVITTPMTPVKWINYIGGLDFGGFVDNTGGSLICKGDPALNRITKYIPQLPDSNFKGETLYLKLESGEGSFIFSPFFVPTLNELDHFNCRVGLGYTTYISEYKNVECEITVFVPIDAQVVVKDIRVRNKGNINYKLSIIPAVEYTHFDALKQFTNADWIPQTMISEKVDDGKYTIMTQYPFMRKYGEINYFTSNQVCASFETDRRLFLGDNGFGSWARPLSLEKNQLSNCEAKRGDNICAFKMDFDGFTGGSEIRVITQLGQWCDSKKELEQIKQYRDEKNVDDAFNKLRQFWDEHLSVMQVESPDEDLNTMINIHNPRQCYITKKWSRYLSLYQLGLGDRGIGIRDSAQDILGVISQKPEEAVALLDILITMQRENGSSYHQFNPKTLVGSEGDSAEIEDRPNYYGDDHLWVIFAICEYVKETGNMAYLGKKIKYYSHPDEPENCHMDTVLNHMKVGLKFTKENIGQHGLPLLGFADWNDPTNLPTGAESVFVAEQYGKALLDVIELFDYLKLEKETENYRTDYEAMKATVNSVAWDGKWYKRYFDDKGKPLGSAQNKVGKIYTNAQSWAMISGFATRSYGTQALDSVYEMLNTKNGIKLSYPGVNGYDESLGGISTYPPGAKENGGIFLHSNPWAMIAETLNGNGDRAYEYYKQINPVGKNDSIDEYECSPYVYPQNILGDEHPQFGLARNSWLSGTASWCYQAATKYILGIKPAYEGLEINPVIPHDWEEFKVERVFRGNKYNIKVKNPTRVSKGIKSIKVNGEYIKGAILPLGINEQYLVEIEMGE